MSLCVHREEAAAATVPLQTRMEDRRTCRCLKTSSTTPERRVRTQNSLVLHKLKVARKYCSTRKHKQKLLSCPCSERVLGERSAHRGVGALRADGQLLAESGKRHLNLEGPKYQEESFGVALQAAEEIRARPGGCLCCASECFLSGIRKQKSLTHLMSTGRGSVVC